jgi:putative transposase
LLLDLEAARRDTRAHYDRNVANQGRRDSAESAKLRQRIFKTAIIGRYRRRESFRVSPSTMSDLNKKIFRTNEHWRNRPIEGEHTQIYLDGIMLKRGWAGEMRNVSLLVAIGFNENG